MIYTTQDRYYATILWLAVLVLGCSVANTSAQTPAQDQTQQLRQEIQAQQKSLDEQKQKLEELLLRLDALESGNSGTPPAAAETRPQTKAASPAQTTPQQTSEVARDPVGDLNADLVRAGELPGSIVLPGKDVSLAIGGFIKVLSYYDTKAENRGAIMFASSLGTVQDDRNGGSAISGELTRMYVDARGKVGDTRVRGYIEWDFNSGPFTLRHAYLTLDGRQSQILAGKYWSNFMDIQTLPEGFSEPVLSGAVFSRQAQVRYTRRFRNGLQWTASIEDAQSNDVLAQEQISTRTPWPDIISTISLNRERGHIQLAGMVRRITIDNNNQKNFGVTGWGLHTSGHVNIAEKDKLAWAFVGGRGLGRYLLGLTSTSGAFVIPENREIIPRTAYGGFTTYRHQWNSKCRSTVGPGYVSVQTDPRQTDAALRASLYGIANLMCSVKRFVTIGGEYSYARRWNRVGSLDNNRFMFGIQLF